MLVTAATRKNDQYLQRTIHTNIKQELDQVALTIDVKAAYLCLTR